MDAWSLNKMISLAPLNVFGVWTFMRGSWIEKYIYCEITTRVEKEGFICFIINKIFNHPTTMNGSCIMSNSCLS
jgi:hypothetical protein